MSTHAWMFRLTHAKTNSERWGMLSQATTAKQHDEILYIILTHATDNHERWNVYQHTFHNVLQERALMAILLDAIVRGDLHEMWAVYNCASPNLAELAYSFIHLINLVHPEIYVEEITLGAEKNMLTGGNIQDEYARFEKVLRFHSPTVSKIFNRVTK